MDSPLTLAKIEHIKKCTALLSIQFAPHVIYRAEVHRVKDNLYCAELNKVRAFGNTPAEACEKFDELWRNGVRE